MGMAKKGAVCFAFRGFWVLFLFFWGYWGYWGYPVSWAPADSRSSCGGRRAVQTSDSDMVWLESVAVRAWRRCEWSGTSKNIPYSQTGPRASLSATLRLASPGAVTARGTKRLCPHRVFFHASPHTLSRHNAAHHQHLAMTNIPSMTKSSTFLQCALSATSPLTQGSTARLRVESF